MKTKKYRKFFTSLYEAGDIPEDLYDALMGKLDEEGKMNKRVYEFFLSELERRRLFEVDGTPYSTENSAKTDGTFKYKNPSNPFWHIAHAITSTVFKFIGWFASGFVFGVWRVPDRKKLKDIGACVSLSNHVGYLDAVLTRYAFGCRKQYIIVAPHNCKKGLGGAILKSATVIPLPISFRGSKDFSEMLIYVAERGGALHFYPEKSMWVGYRKPRPYKEGPFHFADRLEIPVVPMLYCYGRSKGLRKLFHMPKMAIKIADPLYVDRSLPSAEREADLRRRAQDAVKKLYEDFYGIPLEYDGEPIKETADAENIASNTESVEQGDETNEVTAFAPRETAADAENITEEKELWQKQ